MVYDDDWSKVGHSIRPDHYGASKGKHAVNPELNCSGDQMLSTALACHGDDSNSSYYLEPEGIVI